MHHKRRKPKNARAGCLCCHPWKINGVNEQRPSIERQLQESVNDFVMEYLDGIAWDEYDALEDSPCLDYFCGVPGCRDCNIPPKQTPPKVTLALVFNSAKKAA